MAEGRGLQEFTPLRFPYTEIRSSKTGEVFYNPTAPVRIVAPGAGGSLEGPVLLDTGADRTHIPRDVAERLDIDLTGLPERTMSWGDGWEMTVLEAPPGFRAIVGDFVVPLRPVIGRDFGSPVMGHDFLESFRATFDGRARMVELEPNGDVGQLMPDGRVRYLEIPAAA